MLFPRRTVDISTHATIPCPFFAAPPDSSSASLAEPHPPHPLSMDNARWRRCRRRRCWKWLRVWIRIPYCVALAVRSDPRVVSIRIIIGEIGRSVCEALGGGGVAKVREPTTSVWRRWRRRRRCRCMKFTWNCSHWFMSAHAAPGAAAAIVVGSILGLG